MHYAHSCRITKKVDWNFWGQHHLENGQSLLIPSTSCLVLGIGFCVQLINWKGSSEMRFCSWCVGHCTWCSLMVLPHRYEVDFMVISTVVFRSVRSAVDRVHSWRRLMTSGAWSGNNESTLSSWWQSSRRETGSLLALYAACLFMFYWIQSASSQVPQMSLTLRIVL